MKAYKLIRPMPGLPEGVVFLHDAKNVCGNGSPGSGCMVLAWDNGNCQGNWCGETFFLPGQLHADPCWFLPTPNPMMPYMGKARRRYHVSFSKTATRDNRILRQVRRALDQIEQGVSGEEDEA